MLKLEIRTYFPNSILEDIFEKSYVRKNDKITIPGTDSTLEYLNYPTRSIPGVEECLNFTLSFGAGVAAGVIANWLYDKINGKANSIAIDNTEVIIEREKIKIAIGKK